MSDPTMEFCDVCGDLDVNCQCQAMAPNSEPPKPIMELSNPDNSGAYLLQINGMAGEALVQITPTGEVTLHGDPNEAARIFWECVAGLSPLSPLQDAPIKEEIPKLCVSCKEFLAEDEDFEGVLVMINPQVQQFLAVYSKERQDLYPPEVGPAPLGKVIGDIMETMGKAAGWPQ